MACLFNPDVYGDFQSINYVPGKVDEKATQLHAIASLKVLLDATKPQDGVNGTTNPADGTITGAGDLAHDSGRASQGTEVNLVQL